MSMGDDAGEGTDVACDPVAVADDEPVDAGAADEDSGGGPQGGSRDDVDRGRELLERNFALIQQLVAGVCRRKHLSLEDTDDFTDAVNIGLVEHEYKILRQFRGESSLETFLRVVINHQLIDFQRQRWGSWQPSAAAKRLGSHAVLLEKLIDRDHFSRDEAFCSLRMNHGVALDDQELDDLLRRLHLSRTNRRAESLDDQPEPCNLAPGPLEELLAREARAQMEHAYDVMEGCRSRLPSVEALIARMLLGSFTIAEIARALHRRQRPLYRLRDAIFAKLRECMVKHGISHRLVRDLLAIGRESLP